MNKLTVGLESHWWRSGPCFRPPAGLPFRFLSLPDPPHRSSGVWDLRCHLCRRRPERFSGYILEATASIFQKTHITDSTKLLLPSPATKVQSLGVPPQARSLISIYKRRGAALPGAAPSATPPTPSHATVEMFIISSHSLNLLHTSLHPRGEEGFHVLQHSISLHD